jgi:prefoldin subunit 2
MEALKGADQDRKCYRMIGGVLVERTVKEVLPDLTVNAEKVRY